jgi:CubicO group peptidase (beta-lactamase class C family)
MKFPRLKSLLCLTCLTLSAASPALADDSPDINAILEPIRAKHHLPALAGAVFDVTGMITQGSAGVRKAGDKQPVTGDDLWHLGSDTKAMTATLAGTFVAEGKLAWDDPVAKFFPDFAKQIDPALRGVTIAQLLSHRAGLTPNLTWADFDTRNLSRARHEAAKKLLTTPPASPVGQYEYSNAGYVVVGAVLEKIGGKPWEKLITDRLFTPLGMKSAGFGGVGTSGKTDQPWGHHDDGRPVEINGPAADNPPVMGPAGTVHCSLEDWTKFLADQLRGGTGGKALLPAEIYQAIQSPHPADASYGFGWIIGRRPWAGGKILTHNGTNTMNLAICWLGLPNKFGVAVTTNESGDNAEQAGDEAAAALLQWYRKAAAD